jgi:hypothetical protein
VEGRLRPFKDLSKIKGSGVPGGKFSGGGNGEGSGGPIKVVGAS